VRVAPYPGKLKLTCACRADHVDILGSSPLNAAILKIAAGRGDLVIPRIRSRILEYVDKMDWD